MSCLALSLQPTNGSDILLQTREWFPPARALAALSAFRQTRLAFAASKHHHHHRHHSNKKEPKVDMDDGLTAESISSLGDDPLAASSGQLIVGVESKYRVVYRLVNNIYVLGITTADHDNSINVFECIHVINQAVSVIVTACRGVDVTSEKLYKKYSEIYMALDIILRGVSSIRLAAMLASMHADGIAKMVHSAVHTESRVRGADKWRAVEYHSVEHQANVEAFSNVRFELPLETISAGDEVAAHISPLSKSEEHDHPQEHKEDNNEEIKDPFAASDAINKPEEQLVIGFKKTKDPSATDLTVALAGLEIPTLPPAEATQSKHVGVEGFEGEYGGIEFTNEQASLGETFEGFSDAWGGGLDASEFVGPKNVPKKEGLSGLELLQTGAGSTLSTKAKDEASGSLESLLQQSEMKGPEMHLVETISAEFRESLLARTGLMGVVYLKTLLVKNESNKETEFSFKVEGTNSVKRFVLLSSAVSSLGNGTFHVRTQAKNDPIPILRYSLLPRLTPLPLRVRLVKRHSGTLLSVMIQYVSNPELPAPLTDVTFTLKLPVDPTLLQVSPKAALDRAEQELKWHIPEIPLKGTPGRLKVRMPVDSSEEDVNEELEVVAYVKFSAQGILSLSGVCLGAVSEGKTDFYEAGHKYESGVYMCN
ncbi:hypothetical protein ACFE04_010729 [Oxalis oulophora]